MTKRQLHQQKIQSGMGDGSSKTEFGILEHSKLLQGAQEGRVAFTVSWYIVSSCFFKAVLISDQDCVLIDSIKFLHKYRRKAVQIKIIGILFYMESNSLISELLKFLPPCDIIKFITEVSIQEIREPLSVHRNKVIPFH